MIKDKATVNLKLVPSKQQSLHHLRIPTANPYDLPVLHDQVIAVPFPVSFFNTVDVNNAGTVHPQKVLRGKSLFQATQVVLTKVFTCGGDDRAIIAIGTDELNFGYGERQIAIALGNHDPVGVSGCLITELLRELAETDLWLMETTLYASGRIRKTDFRVGLEQIIHGVKLKSFQSILVIGSRENH